MTTDTIYILHFEPPLAHARHYLGSTRDVPSRVAYHRAGRGSPLVRAAVDAGCEVIVSRTLHGSRDDEARLKRQHNTPRLCPLCNPSLRRVSAA